MQAAPSHSSALEVCREAVQAPADPRCLPSAWQGTALKAAGACADFRCCSQSWQLSAAAQTAASDDMEAPAGLLSLHLGNFSLAADRARGDRSPRSLEAASLQFLVPWPNPSSRPSRTRSLPWTSPWCLGGPSRSSAQRKRDRLEQIGKPCACCAGLGPEHLKQRSCGQGQPFPACSFPSVWPCFLLASSHAHGRGNICICQARRREREQRCGNCPSLGLRRKPVPARSFNPKAQP